MDLMPIIGFNFASFSIAVDLRVENRQVDLQICDAGGTVS